MSFGAPKPPDATQTAATQQQYNVGAATDQNKLNSYGQRTAYGGLNYVPDSSSPSGYRIETNLSPQQQGLLNTEVGNKGAAGTTAGSLFNTAGTLANNAAGMYSTPYNLDAASKSTADTLNRWSGNYLQPIFNQQSSNLEADLRNQGLMPGTEAYNNAKNLLARNQGDVTTDYLTKNQGQAFGQALQSYQTPLQTIGGLLGEAGTAGGYAAPTGPTFANTPSATIQPANYQGAVQSNYDSQLKNYENTWNNIGKIGTAGVGLAMAPMTGGTSLAGMFGKSVGNTIGGWGAPSGGYTGWTSGGWG